MRVSPCNCSPGSVDKLIKEICGGRGTRNFTGRWETVRGLRLTYAPCGYCPEAQDGGDTALQKSLRQLSFEKDKRHPQNGGLLGKAQYQLKKKSTKEDLWVEFLQCLTEDCGLETASGSTLEWTILKRWGKASVRVILGCQVVIKHTSPGWIIASPEEQISI